MKKINKLILIIFIILNLLIIIGSNTSYALFSTSTMKISSFLTKTIKTSVHSGYTNVQSFCTDGTYFYVAALTKDTKKHEGKHAGQRTRLLKIRKSDKTIVVNRLLEEIGHCNGMTYNPKTKKIIIATCVSTTTYVWTINSSLAKDTFKKVYTKKSNGDPIKGISTISYNEEKDMYIVRRGRTSAIYLNSEFKMIKRVTFSKKISTASVILPQDIFADSNYIYSVHTVKSNYNNHIVVYDYNGKRVKDIIIKQAKLRKNSGEKIELESMCVIGEYYYLLGNVRKSGVANKMRIYKLKFDDIVNIEYDDNDAEDINEVGSVDDDDTDDDTATIEAEN